MTIRSKQLPSFNGVGASQTATLELPIGPTYHGITLTFGGTAFLLSDMTELRLIANGTPIQTIASGDDLNIFNLFDGRAAADGQIYWDFERYGLDNVAQRELTAIGTGGAQNLAEDSPDYNPVPITTLNIEIDIGSSASAPTLSAQAEQSAQRPAGVILNRRKFIHSPSAAGDFEISNFPKTQRINMIRFKTLAGEIDDVEIKRDDTSVFNRTVAQNNLIQIDGKRVPQENWYVFDPSERGDGNRTLLPTVEDFRVILGMNAAETVTAYVDYIGRFTG